MTAFSINPFLLFCLLALVFVLLFEGIRRSFWVLNQQDAPPSLRTRGGGTLTGTPIPGRVTALACSASASRCALGFEDGRLLLLDLLIHTPARSLLGHRGRVNALSWSPDGAQLASAGSDGRVRIWEAETGGMPFFLVHAHAVTAVSWSPDGKRLASSDRTEILIWHAPRARMLTQCRDEAARATEVLAWSPDGTRLLSATRKQVCIWTPQGTLLHRIRCVAGITAMAWCPDAARGCVALADERGAVHIWEAATERVLFVYQGHRCAVVALAWTPDGTRIISSDRVGQVQTWDVPFTETAVLMEGRFALTAPLSPRCLAVCACEQGGRTVLALAGDGWYSLESFPRG